MHLLVHVTDVEVVGPHRLRLGFDDGSTGVVDFSHRRWKGIFEPLADPAFFCRVRVDEEIGTIAWPNGADIAPDTLHAWAQQRPVA
jgi:hypothetical protein